MNIISANKFKYSGYVCMDIEGVLMKQYPRNSYISIIFNRKKKFSLLSKSKMSINKVIFSGREKVNPEIRYTLDERFSSYM